MKTRLRIQKIVIDIPESESDPWVQLTVQRIEMDDNFNTLNIIDRWGQVHKRISDVALDIQSYDDPVLGSTDNPISVFGLTDAITQMCMAWTANAYDGTINEAGLIMVD